MANSFSVSKEALKAMADVEVVLDLGDIDVACYGTTDMGSALSLGTHAVLGMLSPSLKKPSSADWYRSRCGNTVPDHRHRTDSSEQQQEVVNRQSVGVKVVVATSQQFNS